MAARHRTSPSVRLSAWPTYQDLVVELFAPPTPGASSAHAAIIGDRAFPVAGLQVWNSLPPEVTSFGVLLHLPESAPYLLTYLLTSYIVEHLPQASEGSSVHIVVFGHSTVLTD